MSAVGAGKGVDVAGDAAGGRPAEEDAAARVLERMGALRARFPEGFAAAEASWKNLIARNESPRESREELVLGTAWTFMEEHLGYVRQANEVGGFPTAAFVGIEVSTMLAAHAGWRLGKGVYLYDPTVFGSLWGTPLSGDIPVEALHRLPERCPYVAVPALEEAEEPGLLDGLRGFHAFIEPRRGNRAAQLVLVPDKVSGGAAEGSARAGEDDLDPATIVRLRNEDVLFGSYSVPLLPGESVEEALRLADEQLMEYGRNALAGTEGYYDLVHLRNQRHGGGAARAISRLVSVLLYICSEDSEVEDPRQPGRAPSPAVARRVKKRLPSVFAAREATEWRVAWRLGARIRQESETDPGPARTQGATIAKLAGTPKRPHLRRAHWHSFWRGPRAPERADERELVVRWIPPLPINARGSSEDLPAVVRPVG